MNTHSTFSRLQTAYDAQLPDDEPEVIISKYDIADEVENIERNLLDVFARELDQTDFFAYFSYYMSAKREHEVDEAKYNLDMCRKIYQESIEEFAWENLYRKARESYR